MQVLQKISKLASVKTFKDLADVPGRRKAHGIMSRGRHFFWHLLRCFSKKLHADSNAVPVEFNVNGAFERNIKVEN